MHPFRKLLLISVGRESSFEKDLTPADWVCLFSMAKYQAMIGVLNDGVHRLPDKLLPPEHIIKEWDRLTGKIAEIHARHIGQAEKLKAIFESLGLNGCILKGTGLAQLYPTPERRQCGDIDVWVKGCRKDILKALRKEYDVHDIVYQECKVDIFENTVVEVHFHPTKMYNPFTNAKLQRWLEQHSPILDDAPLTYPDTVFNAVFCMAHMFRHYLEGGLGLRQMLDYYYVLRMLPAAERGPVMRALKHLGMARFAAATMLSLQYSFGLEDEYLLCQPNLKLGERLINDMIKMGNFGVLDPRNRSHEGESKWARFKRKNKRVFSNLQYYPREVLWSPLSRLGQYCWRFFYGYL